MTKIIVSALFVLAVFGAIAVFSGGQKSYDTIKPVYEPAVQAVYATGTVEAVRMIPIAPRINARLQDIKADEGATVTQGQVLAQLEDTDTEQTLRELTAKLTLADKDLARSRTLAKSGAISKSALDEAVAAQKAAQASVDRTRAELSYLQLLAPEDGRIIRRDGEIGELVTADTPVFWMTGGNDLRIATEVDEEDIALVQPGQEVAIAADAFPGQIFHGRVQSITPKGDPVARSYRVRVSLTDNTPLMIGMTAETNIVTQKKDKARMVPKTAVKDKAVWVMQKGKPVLTPVETGIETDNKIEITGGLSDDAKIVRLYDDVTPPEKECAAGDKDC